MPRVEVVFFKEDDGSVPMRDWLDSLAKERTVPPGDIDLAVQRKKRFAKAPKTHSE